MIARVAVDVPVKAVDRLFDYALSKSIAEIIEVGMRVVIPFGNRELMGYVIELDETSSISEPLKEVIRLLDLEPYLTPELITIAKDIAKESATIFIRVLESILPSALRVVYQTKLHVWDRVELPKELHPLFKDQDEVLLPSNFAHLKQVKQALRTNIISQVYDVSNRLNAKKTKMVVLKEHEKAPSSDKQKLVVRHLLSMPEFKKRQVDLIQELDLSPSTLKTLEKNGFITFVEEELYREVKQIKPPIEKNIALNEEQQVVFQRILASIHKQEAFLLHGVTGSGKTEIYLHTIDQVLEQQKQALFLVPEISLTPQMVARVKGRFGERVAILHSGLSTGEKYDEWRRIIRDEVDIVVGARSAVFAPLSNLGVICVDECHEASYSQEETPRYHALDIAMKRGQTHQCVVILGSATPNIETYARAKKGYFTLLELKQRYRNSAFPKPQIVDMKTEFIKGNKTQISDVLATMIQDRLDRHEQTILLINRRGFSTFVLCRQCGHVIMCQNCDISLTYHESEHALKCHYCSHKEAIPKSCPKCGSEHLRFMGTGSQRIESEIQERFPNAKCIRMDGDTTKNKNAHAELLHQFETDGDILLGTQMISKGLDFPKVTLVGIINADSNLYHADFRSPERTFQLITQVSGRAGRNDLHSDCIIQVHNPNHYAIFFAANQDYIGFYQHEMQLRKMAKYIPFYFMIELYLSGESVRDLLLKGKEIARTLKQHLSQEAIILGPFIPEVARIKNRFQAIITIKYKHEEQINSLLFQIKELYETESVYLSIARSSTYV